LAEAGFAEPPHLHFVAADLEQESVQAALARVPYDSGVRTFFAWPGVTMYLTRDAILGTLRSIRNVTVSGSELVFDYLEVDAFRPEKVSDRVRRVMEGARSLGEPMVSGFDPATLRSELASAGFHLVEDLSAADLEDRYFRNRTDGFHAPEHFHFVRAFVA
jgi:methyltransferase (TIGR00027 family)